ncbi:MAG: hypothetical protein LBT63_01000 [Holosporaceae bacterium]|jgi:hypothetical protein|nr:hypothetical protein [Holosporaceae bacterium]
MNNLDRELKSLGEIYWAYDFLKNVEKRSTKDSDFIRIEKALRENLEALNDKRIFHSDYLEKSVLPYIRHRWGI